MGHKQWLWLPPLTFETAYECVNQLNSKNKTELGESVNQISVVNKDIKKSHFLPHSLT